MKKIEIKLSPKQFDILREETGWPGTLKGNFGLISMPLLAGKVMKVLILTAPEFRRAEKFYRRFVPKELKT